MLLAVGCADAAFVAPDGSPTDGSRPDLRVAGDARPDAAAPTDAEAGDGAAVDPDQDDDGTPNEDDCAPQDASRHPDAFELCNGLDDDCDGSADEGLMRECYDGPEETRRAGACR